jgi:integrase
MPRTASESRGGCLDALAAWEGWRGALRGEVSEETWRQYAAAALRFLALSGLARTPIEAISRTHVLTFYGEHARRGHARAGTHAALSSFFGWCDFEHLLVESPMRGVKVRRPDAEDPESLTPDELSALVTHADTLIGRRAALAALLGYSMGLRRKEVCGLRWDDIRESTERWEAHLTETKGNRPRAVPLSPEALAVLAALRTLPERYLRRTREGYVVGVGVNTYSDWMHRAALAAGIPQRKARSHVLRASFATDAMREGADIHVVQRLLGHKKLETTARYLAVLDKDKSDVVDAVGARIRGIL